MESFIGYIKTPQDALIVFEACRRGLLNRIQRRLTSKERMSIQSGSIFAWDEREAGMRRWTDGRTWSPSRVLGSFLTYRELDTKRRPRRLPASSGGKQVSFSYKTNGLIKQSFSICTATNQKIHLISYYAKSDVLANRLQKPSNDPMLNKITIPKGLYPEINPLDIGGGHSASIHSICKEDMQGSYFSDYQSYRHKSVDSLHSNQSDLSELSSAPSLSSGSPQSSDEEISESPSPLSSPYSSQPESYIVTHFLPVQDIAWENIPCSEDKRQLNAIRELMRI
ncbi:Gti1/Pac2 family-domain-containing protein [Pilobolus umbonatus]|nr:Gti1/Pac2 family-domain-containing protein [Pilobolus umbonatus]